MCEKCSKMNKNVGNGKKYGIFILRDSRELQQNDEVAKLKVHFS